MKDIDWLPLTELTLQGNLTIAGFAQKTWTAKRGVCEIHLHAKSGMARIDWNHASVIVSPAVIQHGTLDWSADWEQKHAAQYAQSQVTHSPSDAELSATQYAMREVAKSIDARIEVPSRADEILAEFDKPEPVTLRRKRKPKAD